jgi:hypothetical protein
MFGTSIALLPLHGFKSWRLVTNKFSPTHETLVHFGSLVILWSPHQCAALCRPRNSIRQQLHCQLSALYANYMTSPSVAWPLTVEIWDSILKQCIQSSVIQLFYLLILLHVPISLDHLQRVSRILHTPFFNFRNSNTDLTTAMTCYVTRRTDHGSINY